MDWTIVSVGAATAGATILGTLIANRHAAKTNREAHDHERELRREDIEADRENRLRDKQREVFGGVTQDLLTMGSGSNILDVHARGARAFLLIEDAELAADFHEWVGKLSTFKQGGPQATAMAQGVQDEGMALAERLRRLVLQ